MRRIIILAVLIFFAAGCVYMNTRKGEKPTVKMKAELQTLLNSVSYSPHSNERSVFDCSNKTAYLYDFLTRRGYNCTIMTGANSANEWHAWLIAEKKGKKFWIESTLKLIVWPGYFQEYTLRFSFRSLKEVKRLAAIIGFGGDWDY